ncbi:MAG: amidohydrolase family protein [Acidobacteria bacterium]|nr:amidohydrolase family protein [Acidobacteriota bacterium]
MKNAQFPDGTGADLLMENGRIAAIGPDLPAPRDAGVFDCTGLTVAPGFIDLHSHADLQVLENRREKLLQGVTTEVVGNCGFSPYPCGEHADQVREFANGIFCGDAHWLYRSARDYLAAGTRSDYSVQSLVGHGTLRIALFGNRQDALTEAELDRMNGELEDSLSAGAAGFSTGLMYAPGSAAPVEELIRLCRTVARHGRLYATHMRSYSYGLIEAVREQIEIARRSGCRLQISHLQAVGRANWDKQRQALDLIEAARKQDVDVEFDIYPYTAGSTVLTQLLPQWTLDGGTRGLLALLRNDLDRRRIAEETVSAVPQRWSDIYISALCSHANQHLVGKNLAQIAALRGVEPVDVVLDLLVEENADANMICFNQSEENLRELLSHPLCSVISDGFYVKGRPHPRLHGTFPRLLGEISRNRRWMSLEEAVHKITAKPAARLGWKDRGVLEAGAIADVTVFDARAVGSPADYDHPEQPPTGIRAVFREGRRLL